VDEIIICTRCKGFGFVEFDVGSHKSEYETEVCGACKGSGRLEQTTDVTVAPFVPDENKSERLF